jgi:hypothetical protein
MTVVCWTALIAVSVFLIPVPATAVPSFARQTGLECVNCHLSWPELTPVGREFKLGGYTLIKSGSEERPWFPTQSDGPPPKLPLAAMLQLSVTNTQSTTGADPDEFPRNNTGTLQQFSLFYAGRITDLFGAFVQWSYDGIAHHSAIDNVDVRLPITSGHDIDLSYGPRINNWTVSASTTGGQQRGLFSRHQTWPSSQRGDVDRRWPPSVSQGSPTRNV